MNWKDVIGKKVSGAFVVPEEETEQFREAVGAYTYKATPNSGPDDVYRLLHEEQEANRLLRERVRELEKRERELQQVLVFIREELIDARIESLQKTIREYQENGNEDAEFRVRNRLEEILALKRHVNKIKGI